MKEIIARALSSEAFAPYGDVVEALPETRPGRAYFESIGNWRSAAQPKLWMLTKLPTKGLPIEIKSLERHEFSSQAFVPIDVGRWLVVVAPHAAGGGPDVEGIEAFIASPEQGVNYRANTWHSGLNVFDKVARMVVFMWLDGSPADEEAVPVTPFLVRD